MNQNPAYKVERMERAEEQLRSVFPTGECDEMNLVLFSTSGTHGSALTIEEAKLGEHVTVMILKPRLCRIDYGTVAVTMGNIKFLKRLRETSRTAFARIG